jgi:NADPH2:quinone reductase
VGTLLVQLAKSLGAGQVVATTSTEAKLALACSYGADAAINYTAADWPGQVRQATNGTDAALVLDGVGSTFSGAASSAWPRSAG